jgi:hypothetical protein
MGGKWPVVAGIWQEDANPARQPIKAVGGRSDLCKSHPRAGVLAREAQSQHPNCSPFLDRSAPPRGRPAPFPMTADFCAGLCLSGADDIAYRGLSGEDLPKANTQKGSIPCTKQSYPSQPRQFLASRAVSTPTSSAALPALRRARFLPMLSAVTLSRALSSAVRRAQPATTLAPKPANNLIRPSGRKTSPDRLGRRRAPVAVSHLKDLA